MQVKAQAWRVVKSGYQVGAMNMAIDEALMLAVSEGSVPPTIRFYGWLPACLSLGYAQKTSEIAWKVCVEKGIGMIRRATGGRAILHDREVTYSVVAPENNPLVSGTILESYLKISQGLLLGLHKLGIPAEVVSHRDLDKLGTAACFDSPAFYELVVKGRKAVGSAQTRKYGMILQHGSIIRELDVDALFAVLNFASDEIRERMKEIFKRKACSLEEVTGRKLTDQEIIESVTAGFSEGFGVSLVDGELTEHEITLAKELLKTKYGTEEWNWKR